MTDSLREVRLSSELCQKAEQRFDARFGNLEQFLEFVLKELLRDEAAQIDQAEQQLIEQRLKDLGYV